MLKKFGSLLLVATISLQAHAQTPTPQVCQQLYEDMYVMPSYIYPCSDHEKDFAPLEKTYAKQTKAVMKQCQQAFSKDQLETWEKQTQEKVHAKFTGIKQAIEQDSNAYCQGIKGDFKNLVQKYTSK